MFTTVNLLLPTLVYSLSLRLRHRVFPLSSSLQQEKGGKGQSYRPECTSPPLHHHSPEVDNGELTYYSDSDFWIQLPCAGKPVKQAADWGPCRKAHRTACCGLIPSRNPHQSRHNTVRVIRMWTRPLRSRLAFCLLVSRSVNR
uniref:Uncharacterized protein n=1 Tax=Pipistrellus kuhlii TaxID=59472 RepID=A0A7J7UTH5_PIPKU|nr:hypothetical protein mPipKuh1_008706 [Pipistrellus kuhlii]